LPSKIEDITMILKNPSYLLNKIKQCDYSAFIDLVKQRQLRENIDLMTSRADVKLPGIRSLFVWLSDYEKLVSS